MSSGGEILVACLGPDGVNRLGRLGLGGKAGGPLGAEGAEGVADGLGGAAESGGDLGWLASPGTGQEDLTATQGERLG